MRISNVAKGRQFQLVVKLALEMQFGESFESEVALAVGSPPKLHKFDLASRSRHIVCECKAYTWTSGGNAPQAKISNMREAATYLSLLQPDALKILALQVSHHPTKGESLAAYFTRLNEYLLEGIQVIEVHDSRRINVIRGRLRTD